MHRDSTRTTTRAARLALAFLLSPLAFAAEEPALGLRARPENPRAGDALELLAQRPGAREGERVILLAWHDPAEPFVIARGRFDTAGEFRTTLFVPDGLEAVPLSLQAFSSDSSGKVRSPAVFLCVGTAGHEAPHAVLEALPDPAPIAPYHAMFRATSSTTAGGARILDHWDFGDPDSAVPEAEGMLAAHTFEEAGEYTVALTVVDEFGNTDRVTTTIVVAPFAGRTFYVSSSQGDDGADGLAPDRPLRTLEHALSIAGGRVHEPDRLLLARGDEWIQTDRLRVNGPLRIGAYGTGEKPLLSFADGPEGEGLHLGDHREWGRSVHVADLHLRYLGGPWERDTLLVTGVHGAVVERCELERGGLFLIGYGSDVLGAAVEDCEIRDARRMNLYGQETDWVLLEGSRLEGSGYPTDNPLFCHQLYVCNLENVLIRDTVFDGADTGNNNFGAKLNAVTHCTFQDCEVLRTNNGLCVGTNSTTPEDPPSRNVVVDGCRLHDNGSHDQGAGLWITRVTEVTVRNCTFHANRISPHWGVAGIQLADTDPGAVVRIHHNTFSANDVVDVRFGGDPDYAHIELRNNVFQRTADHAPGEGFQFFEVMDPAHVLDRLDCDHNLYFWDGYDAGVRGFGVGSDRPTHSLAEWQGSTGQDLHSSFADPRFTDSEGRDFTLTDQSPALDRGLVLPTVLDDLSHSRRPKGAGPDLGAFERRSR